MLRFFRTVFRASDADAEDLTQDTFERFYKMMHEYRGEAEWALLEKIARNVGYNRVRSLTTIKRGAVKPESLGAPDRPHFEPVAPQTDPVERMIRAERTARLRQEIEKLSPGQRHCTQLWLAGYTYDEIAKMLRLSLDAVRSRLRDARRLLQERLGVDGELPEDQS
jgi:RNA polymerase sigma factor (sigma-70 family)